MPCGGTRVQAQELCSPGVSHISLPGLVLAVGVRALVSRSLASCGVLLPSVGAGLLCRAPWWVRCLPMEAPRSGLEGCHRACPVIVLALNAWLSPRGLVLLCVCSVSGKSGRAVPCSWGSQGWFLDPRPDLNCLKSASWVSFPALEKTVGNAGEAHPLWGNASGLQCGCFLPPP